MQQRPSPLCRFALILVLLWAGSAAANHAPLVPCDRGGTATGGETSAGETIPCSLVDPPDTDALFTFGTSASVGRSAFSVGGSGTSQTDDLNRRKYVVEGHATSGGTTPVPLVDPTNPDFEFGEAASWARTTANDFGLGVYARDFNPVFGDVFSGTKEASDAFAAVRYDFTNVGGPYLDIPFELDGSFAGPANSSLARVQVNLVDFQGRLLAVFFAASNDNLAGGVDWRELVCEDPVDLVNGCGEFIDHQEPWPGSISRTIKLPVPPPGQVNGMWVLMTADAITTTETDASANFLSSAHLSAAPGPGEQVVLASGQVFGNAPPSTTEFELVAQAGSAEELGIFAGNVPQLIEVTGSAGEVSVAGLPGRARMVVRTEASLEESNAVDATPRALLNWRDTATFTGAERFAFELQVDGLAMLSGPQLRPEAGEQGCEVFLEVDEFGLEPQQFRAEWAWSVLPDGASCAPGLTPSGGGCLEIELVAPKNGATELPESSDPNDGSVLVRFTAPVSGSHDLLLGVTCDAEVRARANEGDAGSVSLEVDLGTEGGVTLVRTYGVDLQGDPVPGAQVLSTTGYDYDTPPPFVQAIPEPGRHGLAAAALATLGWLRTGRGRRARRHSTRTAALLGALSLSLLSAESQAGAPCAVTDTGSNTASTNLQVGIGAMGTYGLDGAGCSEGYTDVQISLGAGVGTLTVENSATLTGSGELQVGVNTEPALADFHTGAQVAITGDCLVSGFFTAVEFESAESTLRVSDGASKTHGQTLLQCGDLVPGVKGSGIVDVRDGGRLEASILSAAHDGPAELRVTNGGFVEFTALANHVLGIREHGSIDVDGGTLTFTPGAFLLTSSTGSGSAEIRVANGGLLAMGGNGGIQPDPPTDFTIDDATLETGRSGVNVCDGCTMVADGVVRGTLAVSGILEVGVVPGEIATIDVEASASSNTGRLIVGSSVELHFEIAGPASFDQIDAEGRVVFSEPTTNVAFIGAFSPTSGTFPLVTTQDSLSATLTGPLNVTGLPPGTEFELQEQGSSIALVVPEPGSASLGGATVLCLLALQRRRCRPGPRRRDPEEARCAPCASPTWLPKGDTGFAFEPAHAARPCAPEPAPGP